MKSETPRRYQMRERADSTRATRERIIEAALELGKDRWPDEITLREVAKQAGVALQTVVNHFGTKEGLLTANIESGIGNAMYMQGRDRAPTDNVEAAVECLVEDYERIGDSLIRNLSLEGRAPALTPTLEMGRKEQRKWVRRVFPAALEGLRGSAYTRRLDLLVCATDVYTWKVLRRDRKLSRAQTTKAIAELVRRLHDSKDSTR